MDPIIGGAIIGAGANFLGNLFGKNSQDSANRTNLEIAQMNNEWSERMMDKQAGINLDQWNREVAYNNEMWDKTNEYNSMASQKQRMRDAGMNPALLLGGNNVGIAQSASSPSSNGVGLPSPSQASVQPFRPDFSGATNSILGFMDLKNRTEMNKLQMESVQIENQYKAKMLAAQLADKITDVKNKDAQRMLMKQLHSMQPTLWQTDINLKNKQAESAVSAAELNFAEKLLKNKELSTFDKRMNVGLALQLAQTAQYAATTQLSKQQFRTEVQKTIHEFYKSQGQKISNSTANRMADAVVDLAKYNAYNRTGSPYEMLSRIGLWMDNNLPPLRW